jgi:lipopolysaccharide/colanic/teichoic acid biosynthesis glycosyltransferase
MSEMNNNLDSQMNLNSETAASIDIAEVRYGLASGVEAVSPPAPAGGSLTFGNQLSYIFSEYFVGLLIVLCSAIFVFVVPGWIVKPDVARRMISNVIRRTVDITGALVGMILTLPFWIILPVLIKLDTPGPVFYVQERVGINRRRRERRAFQKADVRDRRNSDRRQNNIMGKPFNLVKFRTMVQDAEKKCGPVWATKNDPRITRIGRFLRKTRLDEIPQFINILKGDMSIVGPRPERPSFVSKLSREVDNYTQRLAVKPGLTGLAQVENGYDSSVDTVSRKVQYDLEYINSRSLWLDAKIMLKTVKVVITGKGAC